MKKISIIGVVFLATFLTTQTGFAQIYNQAKLDSMSEVRERQLEEAKQKAADKEAARDSAKRAQQDRIDSIRAAKDEKHVQGLENTKSYWDELKKNNQKFQQEKEAEEKAVLKKQNEEWEKKKKEMKKKKD